MLQYGNKGPKVVKNLLLPHSKSMVDLVVHDFKEQIQSLLTDPRISDTDYLFLNDDPFSPPPDQFTTVGNINTGLAYCETYKDLIVDPTKEVLLPILFYLDGTVTGQYGHLPIEALKFTLGIFNSQTQEKAHAWQNAGCTHNKTPEVQNQRYPDGVQFRAYGCRILCATL